ncbi:MAG TPA: RHS repeat-associated core domain-containing protein [Terriglobales bacterium]|nr:RHS repeat-associated core domain-containing protein [Terriglobales bacterium]
MKLHSWLAVMFIILGIGTASGQVATGTPTFGSFGGGPFDTVNLGNLNVHFAIPILNKTGRGQAFSYNYGYDSSLWTPVSVSGTVTWQPSPNWGWQGQTEVATGYIGYGSRTLEIVCPLEGHLPVTTYSGFVYRDYKGVGHPFSVSVAFSECSGSGTSDSGQATDGSGYTIYASAEAGSASAYIVTPSGAIVRPPLNGQTGAATFTDPNGNEITVNNSGQFFDTLSSTTPVLTVSGRGTPASPNTFEYTAPSGGTATYTMNYTQYTVKTKFGFSGVAEYGPLSIALVNSITLPDGTSYSFTYESTPGSCTPLSGTSSCVTGRIASVKLPTGGEVTYAYSGGTNSTGIYSDGSTSGLTRTLSPGGEWQYSRSLVTGTPGPGSTWTTTVEDPNSNYMVINAAEDGIATNPTYFFYETQRQIYQGNISTSSCSATITNNCLLLTTVKCYNANYASCSTAAVSSPITQTDSYRQIPNGSTRLSQVLYNTYGLITDDKEYNFGVALGAAPSSTYLVRETAITFASLTNGIVNKPSTVTVYDWSSGSAVTLASSSYTYDQTTPTATSGTPQHVAITGSRGNLTTSNTSTSSTASLSRTYTYYDTGNLNVAKDINGTTTTTYAYSQAAQGSSTASCGNSFPTGTAISGPGVNLSTSTVWNCVGGIATQSTNPNGNNITSNYTDPDFWRPANVYDQENNEITITYTGETAVEDALQNFNGGNSSSDSLTTMDGFGRTVFTQRRQGPAATTFDTAENDYNSLGQLYRSTMLYTAAASPSSSNTTAPATVTTYDALGRVLAATDADGGQVSYAYINNDVLQKVSGSQTFQRQLEYDGLGRLTSVCEVSSTLPLVGTCGQANSQTGLWTKYTYDALGHLLTVTQNAQAATVSQQSRTFVYDMLGRVTSESNPEIGNNGVNGTVVYTYDSISPCADGTNHSYPGNLVQKKDNAGNFTCYSYDGLHRLLTSGNSSATNTILRKFFYDSESSYPTGITVNNGKTQMVEAQTFNTSNLTSFVTDEFFSYSSRGETTDVYEATPHSGSGVYYHTTVSYWPTGTLKSLSGIPSVPTIYYGANGSGLDGEGRYTQVTAASGTNPATSVTYSTSSTSNPLGALTGVTFGSADSDTFTYDPNTGRISTYTFSVNGQTDAGALTWNTNGTLQKLAVVDSITGSSDTQTCNYEYDDVQRLSSSLCGSIWAQNFTYDSFGNITKSGSSAFAPSYTFSNGTTTNQFFSIPGVTVAYDANGNLLTDNLNSYTWDPNWNTMLTASNGSTTVTNTYDALGRMVENNAGGSYTEFIYGPTGAKLAKVNGTTLIKAFVALPAGAKAIYTSNGLAYYRHSDWLGSSRVTSTAATPTSMYSSTAYAPFGEQYATAGTTDASFTGQDQDTLSNLYDFPSRRQSPSQGRWISPDPAGRTAATLVNPQTWNRYAYVQNNPLALIDPMGLDDDDGGGGGDCDTPGLDECGDDTDDQPPDLDIAMNPMPDLGPDNPELPTFSGEVDVTVEVTDTLDPIVLFESDPVIGWIFVGGVGGVGNSKQLNCTKGLQSINQTMAAVDRANANWDVLQTAADANNLDPAMLAAVAIEESGFASKNENDGAGVGVGVFQITVSPQSGVTAAQANNLAWAANYAAAMLDANMDYLSGAHSNYDQTQLLQATAASYNMGLGNPRGSNFTGNPNTIDNGTTNGHYGSTVLSLMDCF